MENKNNDDSTPICQMMPHALAHSQCPPSPRRFLRTLPWGKPSVNNESSWDPDLGLQGSTGESDSDEVLGPSCPRASHSKETALPLVPGHSRCGVVLPDPILELLLLRLPGQVSPGKMGF